jgi:hypothetical protein
VLLVSSLDRDKGIGTAGRLLITAMARFRNTGMSYRKRGRRLDRVGRAPIRIEGVRAGIGLSRSGRAPRVYALDVVGRRRAARLDVAATRGTAAFRIDGGKFRTVYYEVVYG